MDTRRITSERLARSVIAVPPMARNSKLELAPNENKKIIQFLEQGGVSTLLYGGNAVFYHVRPSEYAAVLSMLVESTAEETLVVPSVGPAFGTMMDQVSILRDYEFPTVMILPQRDICDAGGIARGIRSCVDALGKPIVLYIKHDRWLPADIVGRLHSEGMLSWIKYAVVRDAPEQDDYLREILEKVPGEVVVSGIGEQPAIVHMRDFGVISFTSGCVCINPSLSQQMLLANRESDWAAAETMRLQFADLEDLRNRINPIRVLHRAVELAEIAETGPMYPLLGELTSEQAVEVKTAAGQLRQRSPSH